ncbi:MAG: DUF1573 domain-containing protein [Planctomycetaceae bacterium]|nr:DUF1573 domain-containing protein [Planctomycetaceae bacterium]
MAERRKTLWLTLAGLLPCLMAVVAEAIPARPAITTAAQALPELSFAQYGVSYPEGPPRPVIDAHFDFENRSDVPVTIDNIEPSCGCLRCYPARERKTYQPGETGTLVVRMFTANEKPGPHFYTVAVTVRGRETRTEQLTFRASLPERKISLEPSEVYFYQLTGEPDSRTIFLTDYRTEQSSPLEVVDVESLSPRITAKVHPIEEDPAGHRRVPITLTVPGDVPPGRETTFVRISTNDPEFSQLAFPVLIEGRREIYGPPIAETSGVDVFAALETWRTEQPGPVTR